ncbi:MltA domain-containing protein [Maritimibacter sp. UBA3975]|uniref:murein transglycosylase A n=1 Tax=Maritimibacter sp. UBA3975 TaxID=1946833 RepID=UPI000C0B3ABC|nr:MltA domain-containing protein [Maritimibacter sp. UBA3975]MAM63446.1 murein transglycosylase [Maritimibacter sp.]|tara:strand:+ start:31586 stop:32626 length:1041 start_codon:yes stop_codon:yes gene_type:complete
MGRLVGLALAGLVALAGPVRAALDEAEVSLLSFSDLPGWEQDDHGAAFNAFLHTCELLDDPQWDPICAVGFDFTGLPRDFFELFFRPVMIEDGQPGLFTAYYEPEIRGSERRSGRFDIPVYARPPEIAAGTANYTRREIEEEGVLSGRGLEIAWVEDPVELQFLQIQGSGRIRLSDGSSIRLGFGGHNGHSFRSLGDELVRRGIYSIHQVSAEVIKNWVARNPVEGRDLLSHNTSYVFFTELEHLPPTSGPIGAMARSISAGRTIAVDPEYTPLGAPVWIDKGGAEPFSRLMVAQDTGSRIKGAQRADIFWGTGDDAGKEAGRIKDPGRLVVLLPIQRAYSLVPED